MIIPSSNLQFAQQSTKCFASNLIIKVYRIKFGERVKHGEPRENPSEQSGEPTNLTQICLWARNRARDKLVQCANCDIVGKFYHLTREFHVKFHVNNRYRTIGFSREN